MKKSPPGPSDPIGGQHDSHVDALLRQQDLDGWWRTGLLIVERETARRREDINAHLRELTPEDREGLRVLPAELTTQEIVYHPADLFRRFGFGFLSSDLCTRTLAHLAFLSSRDGWTEVNDLLRLTPDELRDFLRELREERKERKEPDTDLRSELWADKPDRETRGVARRVLEEFFAGIAGPKPRKPKPNRDHEIATRVYVHVAEGKTHDEAIEAVRVEMGKPATDRSVESAYKRARYLRGGRKGRRRSTSTS